MWLDNILEAIGNTPLVRLHRSVEGLRPTILAKLEYMNPGGSIKDRIGLAMLEAAEKAGAIKPGGTLIEGTSGNTGMGLALAAAVKGYHCIFTMPDKMSQEKIDSLRALGAEVIVTPTQVEHHDPRSYHSVALRLSKEIPNSVFPNQYDNPANTKAHYETTGPEIWEQTAGKVTHVVIGVGTGGTVTGVGRYLKEKNPSIKIIGADPQGSIFAEMFASGKKPQVEPYKVEGIGQDEMPLNVDFSVIDEIHTVGDRDAFLKTRALARSEGIFAGGSAGAALHVAQKISENLTENEIVVVIIPDSGTRYLSKIYNDNWMKENQFVESPIKVRASQVVRDKVHQTKLVFIPLGVKVQDAVTLMRDHDISQVPVMESGEVVGSISEARILDILVSDPEAKIKPVAEYMEAPFPVLSDDSSLTDVASRMGRNTPAILVKQQGGGYDIITKSDLIFFLTKQTDGKGRS